MCPFQVHTGGEFLVHDDSAVKQGISKSIKDGEAGWEGSMNTFPRYNGFVTEKQSKITAGPLGSSP